jgi:hypothetical protein
MCCFDPSHYVFVLHDDPDGMKFHKHLLETNDPGKIQLTIITNRNSNPSL